MTELAPSHDAIVREVVRRLLAMTAPGSAVEQTTENNTAQPTGVHAWRISDRVVSVAALERCSKVSSDQLIVQARAVITPAARDWLAQRGVSVQRAGDGDWKAAGPAGSAATRGARDAEASIAAARPTVSPLPAARLWWIDEGADDRRTEWLRSAAARRAELTRLARPTEADVAGLAASLPAQGCGVWVTRLPALVLCAANRRPDVHAVWGLDFAALIEASAQMNVNWLVVDPGRLALSDWGRMVDWMVGSIGDPTGGP